MRPRRLRHGALACAMIALGLAAPPAAADDFAPYGKAALRVEPMPAIDTVWDVNYDDPRKLSLLPGFIRVTREHMRGKVIVVTHGPELRAFARENYETYQAVVDPLAELAKEGVEFRLCHAALRAAGYEPQDMHGFVTVVPVGFSEIALWQSRGYRYVNPVPLSVRDVRFLEQPQLRKE